MKTEIMPVVALELIDQNDPE